MMRRIMACCGASLLLVVGAGSLAAQEDGSGMADAKALMGELAAAWSEGEPGALADLWAADGDYVNAVGRAARGREEIAGLFREERRTIMKGTSLAIEVGRVRQLGPDLLLVDATADLKGIKSPEGRSMNPLRHLLVAVAQRQSGHWRLLAARLSVPVPAAPSR